MWEVFNEQIAEGEKKQFFMEPDNVPGYRIPVTVVNGAYPGKVILVVAGTHSMELPAIPAVVRVAKEIDPAKTHGRVIFVHTMTWSGLWRRSIRFLPEDHANLNNIYPGKADGTIGERIANYFATRICPQVDFILDMHSGAPGQPLDKLVFFNRRPQVREAALEVAKQLEVEHLLEGGSSTGIYSYSSTYLDIPGVILERGCGGHVKPEWIAEGIRDIKRVLNHFKVYDFGDQGPVPDKILCKKSEDFNSDVEGIWYPAVSLYQHVKTGELLGHVEDIWGNTIKEYYADQDVFVYYYTDALSMKPGWMLMTYGYENAIEKL